MPATQHSCRTSMVTFPVRSNAGRPNQQQIRGSWHPGVCCGRNALPAVSGGNNLHLTDANVMLSLFCCMSARKVESPGSLQQHVTVEARQSRLSLSSDSVIISKHGIEFRSTTAFSPWTEMTMTLQSPQDGGRVHCNGVVISCSGNRHTGYHVSMVFTNLSKQAEERLSLLAVSQLS